MRDTTLVLFGSPTAGTPAMRPRACRPGSAAQVLILADKAQTTVSYYTPAALAARHHPGADLAAKLAGIATPHRRARHLVRDDAGENRSRRYIPPTL